MARAEKIAPASRATKKAFERKLLASRTVIERAKEDHYVIIYDATQAGMTLADIAYLVENITPSTVAKYRDKGERVKKNGSSSAAQDE